MVDAQEVQETSHFHYISGDPSLDFTNTVSGWREKQVAGEHLDSYPTLVEWADGVGIVDSAQAKALLAEALRSPEKAEEVLRRAISLRESIYRIFVSHIHAGEPSRPDLDLLDQERRNAMPHQRLEIGPDGYRLVWEKTHSALDAMLWPVAESAAALLLSDNLRRVKQCGGESCGWLFIDRSKNQSRRWCDMKDCGNTTKVKRFRKKSRQQKQPITDDEIR